MISVIVPVYNSEKYLKRCIDSILAQTYTDFELILIDDGSTDSSGNICDEYTEMDDRIVVFHQDNKGQAVARNVGLDYVFEKGNSEWIAFVDSDDVIHPQMLELLYKHIKDTSSRLIAGDFKFFSKGVQLDDKQIDSKDITLEIMNPEEFFTESEYIETVPWGKLYHRDCFNDIRYPEGEMNEDNFVTYRIIFCQQTVLKLSAILYYYFENPDGISAKSWSPNKISVFKAYQQQLDFFKENNYFNAEKKVITHTANVMCKNIRDAAATANYAEYTTVIRKMLRTHLKKYRKIDGTHNNRGYYAYAYPKRYRIIRGITTLETRIKVKIKRVLLPSYGETGLIGTHLLKQMIKRNNKRFHNRPDENIAIDFVVTWVDDKDLEWQKLKRYYENTIGLQIRNDNPVSRYRDWDNFHYWFRAVEKYAPWVRNVFLVTSGHTPEWLNIMHPKLRVIKHDDFIPTEYLPTFSSHTIELNLWRIKELSEHFVYFNDDMFLTSPVKKTDFFEKGLPKYCPLTRPNRAFENMTVFEHVLMNNIGLINSKFNFRNIVSNNPEKWLYPYKSITSYYNYRTYKDGYLSGMEFSHVCVPYRKRSMRECANVFSQEIASTCRNKFRTYQDINHQVFQLWGMMNASFVPVEEYYHGRVMNVSEEKLDYIHTQLTNGENKCFCINDNDSLTKDEFENLKPKVKAMLEEKFPKKSEFEK